MPKRTRHHQLETESRIAFSGLIPKDWVFRDIKPDYGIDGIVEVFDEKNNTSGGIFLVQLKATDEKEIKKALHVVLKTDSGEYYKNIVLPVLIVLYHSHSNSVYARFFEKRFEIPNNQKTFTFPLSESDLWSNKLVKKAHEELSKVKSATDIGLREKLIKEYYEYQSSPGSHIDFIDMQTISKLKSGNRITHYVFGEGVIEDITDYYMFVKFDRDTMARKFLPINFREFKVI